MGGGTCIGVQWAGPRAGLGGWPGPQESPSAGLGAICEMGPHESWWRLSSFIHSFTPILKNLGQCQHVGLCTVPRQVLSCVFS